MSTIETTSPLPPRNDDISKRIVGFAAIGLGAVLVVLFACFLFRVVIPLGAETNISQQLTTLYIDNAKTGQSVGEDTLRYLMSCEYAAAYIRTVNVQITFAMVGGLFMVCVGVLLFAAGLLAPFEAAAEGTIGTITLKKIAPGTLAAIMGAIILGLGVMRDIQTPSIELSHSRPAQTPKRTNKALNISSEPIPDDSWYLKKESTEGDPDSP